MVADWVPIISAAMGAVVGAGTGYNLARPRITITVDRVLVQPSRFAHSEPIQVNASLLARLRESPWLDIAYADAVTSPERTYVTYLEMCRLALVRKTQVSTLYEDRAERFRSLAGAKDWGPLFNEYKLQQEGLWPTARQMVAFGGKVFQSNEASSGVDQDSADPVHPWVDDPEHHIMVVDLEGSLVLGFPYGEAHPAVGTKLKELACRVSLAFAHERAPELVAYFTAIRDHLKQLRGGQDKLLSDVEAELERFDRLQVEFLVSNVGRTGVSIAADGAAEVDMTGYVPDQAGAVPIPMSQVVRMPLRLRRADTVPAAEEEAANASYGKPASDEARPLMLSSGETLRLVATSEDLLRDMQLGEALLSAYKGGERELRLLLGRFAFSRIRRGNRSSLTRIQSGQVLFRDLRFGSLLQGSAKPK